MFLISLLYLNVVINVCSLVLVKQNHLILIKLFHHNLLNSFFILHFPTNLYEEMKTQTINILRVMNYHLIYLIFLTSSCIPFFANEWKFLCKASYISYPERGHQKKYFGWFGGGDVSPVITVILIVYTHISI